MNKEFPARGADRRQPRRATPHRGRRPSRPTTTATARSVAFEVLLAVEQEDAYANLTLPTLLRTRRIYGRDAAFATELTYGTLRMQGRYDSIIAAAATRPLTTLDTPVLIALRLGAHQLLGMRVPAHAAVSETVALARQRISAGPAALINAVLRRISEKELSHWLTEVSPGGADGALAMEHSHPEWIIRAFRQALRTHLGGSVEEELTALLAANNTAPTVHLCLRPGLATERDLGQAETVPARYARTARYLEEGNPGDISGIHSGTVGVQDEGSQLVTLAALTEPISGPDETWLDICAGPGGKAALAAAVLADQGGGTFVANELHAHRTKLVDQNLRATPASVRVSTRTGDGREIGDLEAATYDRVIVDAPCTGLGALRRRPESRWRRTAADLPELTALQRDLLLSALKAVRVGGIVAYITCSPHIAETHLTVKDAMAAAGRQEITTDLVDACAALTRVSKEAPEGIDGEMVQLWPHLHGTDAMFLALIRRTG